jgi:hypothetical protein
MKAFWIGAICSLLGDVAALSAATGLRRALRWSGGEADKQPAARGGVAPPGPMA